MTPTGGQNMFGRDGFLVDGDNSKHNKSASKGCIILDRNIKENISASNDRELSVVG